MKEASWTCLKCRRGYVKEWLGGVSVMGSVCPRCGGVGISSDRRMWETGCLKVEGEVRERGVHHS
jgi:hypothetical protein